jgi:site-specific recombinase XerC
MGRRNYAILLLLSRLGLRAAEIVGLNLEDIDWSNALITVLGKGRTTSTVAAAVRCGPSSRTVSTWRPTGMFQPEDLHP